MLKFSWGSGANPWGQDTKEDQFYAPNHWDGILEVVGVTGVMHLGQIQSGLRTGVRIAQVRISRSLTSTKIISRHMDIFILLQFVRQGGHIKIHLNSEIPVQVDGEPWMMTAGDLTILKSALKVTYFYRILPKTP